MSLTPERREQRRKYIGSSDVPAILGKSPFKTAADVYLEKVHEVDDIRKGATDHGQQIEISVLQWAADELGYTLDTDQFRVAPDGILAASHDAIVRGKPEGIEAKTAAVFHWYPGVRDEWGDAGTDHVPDHVLLQAQEQCYVSNLEIVWVPCLIGGRGFQMFRVERNDRLIEIIVATATKFWNDNVIPMVPPTGVVPSLDVVRHLRRIPNKVAVVPGDLITGWLVAKENFKQAESAKDLQEATLLAALDDAEAAESACGSLTYFEQTRKSYQVQECKYRVLRHQKPKGV